MTEHPTERTSQGGAPGRRVAGDFDYAPVHVLTTGTLAELSRRHPEGRFDMRRFRPNLLIAPRDEDAGAIEQSWLGRTLALGAAQLYLLDPCPRCVITTLPQGDLPRDPAILRALHAHTSGTSVTLAPGAVFSAVAGVYGRALRGGDVRVGDIARLTAELAPSERPTTPSVA